MRLAVSQFVPGQFVAGYRVERLLGRGGMGVVYQATQLSLQRTVALKLLSPELASDQGFRARFRQEATLLASLEHPHVLPIHEAGETEGLLFLAMRYVEGSDLHSQLEQGALAPERALRIVSQLAAALAAAHERGLVHRDVKPANVLLTGTTGEEHAYLTDFGLARSLEGRGLTRTGEFLGSVDYLAPEQIEHGQADARSDIYALGCLLYACLTGAPPFAREQEAATLWAHLNAEPPAPSRLRPELPAVLDQVIATALAKDPEQRYQTAGEFAQALRATLAEEAPPSLPRAELVPARPETWESPAAARRHASAPLLLAACVLLAAGGVAAFFTLGDAGSGPTSNVIVSIDPRSGSVDRRVAVGNTPTSIAVGSGGVWVLNAGDATLTELDPSGRVVRTLGTSGTPADVATAGGSVWVADGPNVVLRIDPATGNTADTITLNTPKTGFGPFVWLAVGRGSLWVSAQERLARIDLRTADVRITTLPPADWGPIAVAPDAVWEAETKTLYHLDAEGRHVVGSLAFPQGPLVLALGFVWALNTQVDVVAQIDPRTNTVVRTIPVGSGPTGIAYGDGLLWVVSGNGTMTKVDPRTARVTGTVRVGGTPQDVAVGYGRVWVSVA